MTNPEPPPDDWEADWESHRRRQLTAGLAATPAQRLAWLEEMIAFAHRCGALPKPPSES
jgi:hypothetical protein